MPEERDDTFKWWAIAIVGIATCAVAEKWIDKQYADTATIQRLADDAEHWESNGGKANAIREIIHRAAVRNKRAMDDAESCEVDARLEYDATMKQILEVVGEE